MIAKSSPVDSTPTSLTKACPAVLSELVAHLANCSFMEGCFPDRFKRAQVTPLLMRDGLDENIPANYRHISNLNTISKLMERLALVGLRQHLVGSPSFNSAQSAYRRRHSTETALLLMTDFAHRTIDRGEATRLIALDISAAFDMVAHSTLLDRLSYSFGIDDVALRWIKSYLSKRSQFVRIGTAASKPTVCDCGVPQRSLLGPILFTVYTSPVAKAADAYGVVQQQYADDTQLYIAMSKMSSANAVCREWTCVKPRHIGSCSIFDVSACQRTFCNFNQWCSWIYSCSVQQNKAPCRDAGWEPYFQWPGEERFVIFVLLWLKRWLTLLLVLLFSHESTTLIHCIQECHLLIFTNCSWCRKHFHALLLPPGNGTTSSHRSRECTGYRYVNVSIWRLTYSIRFSGEPQHLNSLLMDYKPTRSLRPAKEHLLVVPRTKLSSTSRAFSVAA